MIKIKQTLLFLPLLFILSNFLGAQALEIPHSSRQGDIIHHNNYTLSYVEQFELAQWVAYELTGEEVLGPVKRKDSFKPDPLVRSESASLADYKGSGFDRGHLAPAADMKMSKQSMSESFYMSNMAPQRPNFNRGIWLHLESCLRTWAVEKGGVYVVTGPVLNKENYPTIGENGVAIPELFYKVVLDYRGEDHQAIAFILPNRGSDHNLSDYALSVDEAEKITGLDFFPLLEDTEEATLEASFTLEKWPFDRYTRQVGSAPSADPKKGKTAAPLYWINSGSKTYHLPSCTYYGKSKKGYYSKTPQGKPCKRCQP